MTYYTALGLEREPFSTSPDPEFFFLTREHETALTNALIELRLKRGLSVIMGDVGTGKTTLSRKLVQCLRDRGDFVFHIVLDPSFATENYLLASLIRNFSAHMESDETLVEEMGLVGNDGRTRRLWDLDVVELREALERFLYRMSVVENRTVVLIIDEAQKLSQGSMETLRVLLNFETNENKMLQLVLLGQLELYSKIQKMHNFGDRVSFRYTLNPLDFEETKEMIQFRIKKAGYNSKCHLFLEDAIRLIHRVSRGYPRKTTLLCHRALKQIVIKNKWVVDEDIVRELVNEDIRSGWVTPVLN